MLFLPKYSPDLNKIEHDFVALKKRRAYAYHHTSLDSLMGQHANLTLQFLFDSTMVESKPS